MAFETQFPWVFSLGNFGGGQTEAQGVRKAKGFLLFVALMPSLYCCRSDCLKDKVPA